MRNGREEVAVGAVVLLLVSNWQSFLNFRQCPSKGKFPLTMAVHVTPTACVKRHVMEQPLI